MVEVGELVLDSSIVAGASQIFLGYHKYFCRTYFFFFATGLFFFL